MNDEILLEEIKKLKEGDLVPSFLTNEEKAFIFLLNEKEESFSSLNENQIFNINILTHEMKVKYENEIYNILYLVFYFNETLLYEVPFILNNESELNNLKRFFEAPIFQIIIGHEEGFGILGPFNKIDFFKNKEWDDYKKIEDEKTNMITAMLKIAIEKENLMNLIILSSEGNFDNIIDFDEPNKIGK